MTLRKALKSGLRSIRLPGATFTMLDTAKQWFIESSPAYVNGDGWINVDYFLEAIKLKKRHLISKKWEVK